MNLRQQIIVALLLVASVWTYGHWQFVLGSNAKEIEYLEAAAKVQEQNDLKLGELHESIQKKELEVLAVQKAADERVASINSAHSRLQYAYDKLKASASIRPDRPSGEVQRPESEEPPEQCFRRYGELGAVLREQEVDIKRLTTYVETIEEFREKFK